MATPSAVQQLNDVTVAADVVQRRAVGQLADAAFGVVLRVGSPSIPDRAQYASAFTYWK